MKKAIVMNATSSETRIAILEDQALVELYVEQPERERMVGDIYKGVVENVVDAIQAAFVDIGLEQNGFLPFADVGDQILEFSTLAEAVEQSKMKRSKKRTDKSIRGRARPKLKKGQEVLVQVTKEPLSSKGARLTTAVSIPGRFLVLVPYDHTIGVSRKIVNIKERSRLRVLANSLRPKGFGLIIRTVAVGKDAKMIQSDLEGLYKAWKTIEEKMKKTKGPRLLHKEMGVASSVIRDLFSLDISQLVVDSRKHYGSIKKYLKDVAPGLSPRLELYRGKAPIFDTFGIEDEIEKSLSRKIWMKSGGYLIFDQTEAMVVIDVNSGRSIEHKDHELHALKIDLEAAREIAHQLRLRDIGGIVVIDFIDLRFEKNRKKLLNDLKKELSKDRAASDILPMNDFGLVSLTRKRVRPSLLYQFSDVCPRCGGVGRVVSKNSLLTQIERKILQIKSETKRRKLILKVPPDLVDYLTKGLRSRIRHLMMKHLVVIEVIAETEFGDEHFILETVNQKGDD
jgi:ribonuclease G